MLSTPRLASVSPEPEVRPADRLTLIEGGRPPRSSREIADPEAFVIDTLERLGFAAVPRLTVERALARLCRPLADPGMYDQSDWTHEDLEEFREDGRRRVEERRDAAWRLAAWLEVRAAPRRSPGPNRCWVYGDESAKATTRSDKSPFGAYRPSVTAREVETARLFDVTQREGVERDPEGYARSQQDQERSDAWRAVKHSYQDHFPKTLTASDSELQAFTNVKFSKGVYVQQPSPMNRKKKAAPIGWEAKLDRLIEQIDRRASLSELALVSSSLDPAVQLNDAELMLADNDGMAITSSRGRTIIGPDGAEHVPLKSGLPGRDGLLDGHITPRERLHDRIGGSRDHFRAVIGRKGRPPNAGRVRAERRYVAAVLAELDAQRIPRGDIAAYLGVDPSHVTRLLAWWTREKRKSLTYK